MASMKATVEPLPLVPATVTTRCAGRCSVMRAATSRTRSSPIAIELGCWRSMYASQSARSRFIATCSAGCAAAADRASQRAVYRFAEEQRVMAAVVEADDFQMVDVGTFQQVERGRR